jgi:hypothetical protein
MTVCEDCGIDHGALTVDARCEDIAERTYELALETTRAMIDIAKTDGISMVDLAAVCSAWENALVGVLAMNASIQARMGAESFPDVEVDREWMLSYLERLVAGIRDKLIFYAGDVLADNGFDHLDPRFVNDPNAKVRAEILDEADGS